MDKALFRAYVRELVKEEVENQVKKILPKLLGEAVAEVKSLQESASSTKQKPKFDRKQLAEMMGLERDGDTIRATRVMPNVPEGVDPKNPAVAAINKDYSSMMKALKLT
jgi:copper chaperone CopZ